MPVPLHRLRQDQRFREQVQRSLELRGLHPSLCDDLDACIDVEREARIAWERASKEQRSPHHTVWTQAQERLQHCLDRIPNIVDEHIGELLATVVSNSNQETTRKPPTRNDLVEPLFCIGGLTEIGAHLVLSDIGIDLVASCEQVMVDWALSLAANVPRLAVPDGGQAAWRHVLQAHGGQTWFDRRLPAWYLLQCHGTLDTILADRHVQLVLVAGSSLVVDVRPLQSHLLASLVDLFQRLVPGTITKWRPVPPHQLGLDQASAVVLTSCDLELARIETTLDYHTAGMRHGSARDPRRCASLVVVRLCSTTACVDWMLAHAVIHGNCLALPASLLATNNRLPLLVRLQRRVRRGKHGKRLVETLSDEKPTLSNIERIRHEAMSCPFSFLPFYHR